MVLSKLDDHPRKTKLTPNLSQVTKINPQQINDLTIRPETKTKTGRKHKGNSSRLGMDKVGERLINKYKVIVWFEE